MQARTRNQKLAVAAAVVLVAAAAVLLTRFAPALSGLDPTNPKIALSDIEATVSRLYPVPEVSADRLAKSLAAGDTIVFDVREPAEFDQSHIAGAIRIDPGLSKEAFFARFGEAVKGKTVVFYCAVGVRSGKLLANVQSGLPTAGAKHAYNLRGGIFRWSTAGAPLQSTTGATSSVHPYDSAWGQLLDRTRAAARGGMPP